MKIKNDFEFEIIKNVKRKTVLELRTFFYKQYTRVSKGKNKGVDPNALELNPKLLVNDKDPFSTNKWYAVYYRTCALYYVCIEQSKANPLIGPHVAKLYYQVYPGRTGKPGRFEWIGTTTFKCSFFDELKIEVHLRKAIRTRAYYVGEDVEDIVIECAEPSELEVIATV